VAQSRIPSAPDASATPRIPGRISGFILACLAVVTVMVPILSVPLGAVGLVQSLRARRALAVGAEGRGLATAALVICAIALVATLTLLTISTVRAFQLGLL
jgi:hypothetical protein